MMQRNLTLEQALTTLRADARARDMKELVIAYGWSLIRLKEDRFVELYKIAMKQQK